MLIAMVNGKAAYMNHHESSSSVAVNLLLFATIATVKLWLVKIFSAGK